MILARSRHTGTGDSSTQYYDLKSYTLNVDGQLAIRAYGGEEGETRWRGYLLLAPYETNYDFWYWMTRIKQVSEIVEEHELENWKRQYTEGK